MVHHLQESMKRETQNVLFCRSINRFNATPIRKDLFNQGIGGTLVPHLVPQIVRPQIKMPGCSSAQAMKAEQSALFLSTLMYDGAALLTYENRC